MHKDTITITITMPPDAPATVLMGRGNLAVTHTYSGGVPGTHNDKHALQAAYDKLTALEANSPQVPDLPEPTKPERKSKPKRKAKDDAEPTVEIPLAKGTRTVPISRVKLTGGETDAAAYQQALACAGRLIDSGLWDGESPLHIPDVYALGRKMKPYQTKELALFTLEELLDAPAAPKVIPMPTATDEPDDDDEPTLEAVELAVGVTVTWAEDVTDTDDELIPFTTGRIVEIDGDEAWVESPEATADTWIATTHLITIL
ncbi:MAG: hypothetical protein AAFU54_21425 [Chloroflexota bacterium]